MLGAPIRKLRKAGLSRAKTLYIRDLAAHVANDSINFRRFRWMNDEEIIEHLTMVKGIGRWTAEMFLMFNLWRPDVLPVGDLGVRNAAMKALRDADASDGEAASGIGRAMAPLSQRGDLVSVAQHPDYAACGPVEARAAEAIEASPLPRYGSLDCGAIRPKFDHRYERSSPMRPIKFAVGLPNNDFAATRATAERAEALGFHSVSLDDHFFMRGLMEGPQSPHLECFTTLSAIAALTKRVRLVQMVTSMSYRNPALLAKMTSTLDQISGGRVTVGVGAGWFREEYAAYNFPYPSNAERIEQLAEGIKVLKAMWTEDEPTYHGRYFKIDKAWNFPKPAQKPHPPLLIGGSGKKVLEITAARAISPT